MQTPHMPNMPGTGAMNDTLDFVKNLWGNMGVPGIAAPTLSVDDLDKKIKDLQAVEVWLNVNTSMLRATIQALEVQRATLSALRTMGEAMAGQGVPNPFAAFAQQAAPTDAPAAAPAPDPAQAAGAPQAAPAASPADAAQAMGMANPALWWHMMQEQFKQALTQAAAAGAAQETPPPPAPGDKATGGSAGSKPHARKRGN